MKYLFCLHVFILFFASSIAQSKTNSNQFTLKGKIAGQDGWYIHLNYYNSLGKYENDSCLIKNGEFEFSGNIESPVIANFYGKRKSRRVDDPNATDIFIQPANMQVIVEVNNFKKAKLSGSKAQNEFCIYNERYNSLEKKWGKVFEEINDARLKNDIAKIEDINDKQIPIYRAENDLLNCQFIKQFPYSYVSARLLIALAFRLPVDSLKIIYSSMSPIVQQSKDGKYILGFIAKTESLATGRQSPDFSQTDIEGNSVSLHDFRGKYILLDFWASYCVPCREENPFLRKLYMEYKNKGFTIISFSVDRIEQKTEWLDAVQKDSLAWAQLCDFKGWQSQLIDQYNLSGKGIPSNFLIGTKGEILAQNLHGEELEKKLNELIK
jgi:peroxiredoxin